MSSDSTGVEPPLHLALYLEAIRAILANDADESLAALDFLSDVLADERH